MNIAVVGAGYWGKKVIQEYLRLSKEHPSLNLSLVCDSQDTSLKHCTEAFGIPETKLSTDYKEALISDSVDAVHICTPNETHYPICKEALMHGKHVLLEKPMALNAREAWQLVGFAEQKGLILQVGHIFRFNNALRIMRDLVAKSYFGDLYYLKLQWTTLEPSPLNRDIIFDLGPHPVDIVNYILDKWPTKVTCKAQAYRRKLLEELAYFTLEFEGELLAHVELSWLQPGKVRQLNVIGSQKTGTVDCLNQSIRICQDGVTFDLDVDRNNTILEEVAHFTHSIVTARNHENSGNNGARNVAILEDLRHSLRENRTVDVNLQA
jgi:UDP-N-acetylglucosamine 3-dehydrogenase